MNDAYWNRRQDAFYAKLQRDSEDVDYDEDAAVDRWQQRSVDRLEEAED